VRLPESPSKGETRRGRRAPPGSGLCPSQPSTAAFLPCGRARSQGLQPRARSPPPRSSMPRPSVGSTSGGDEEGERGGRTDGAAARVCPSRSPGGATREERLVSLPIRCNTSRIQSWSSTSSAKNLFLTHVQQPATHSQEKD
jgi:hypothetical protein